MNYRKKPAGLAPNQTGIRIFEIVKRKPMHQCRRPTDPLVQLPGYRTTEPLELQRLQHTGIRLRQLDKMVGRSVKVRNQHRKLTRLVRQNR